MESGEFFELVSEQIREHLSEEYGDAVIQLRKVQKINLEGYCGLEIKAGGNNVSPVIPLEPFWNDYTNGKPLELILADVAGIIERNSGMKGVAVSLSDYSRIRKKVSMFLINADLNREYLKDKPYRLIADLALVYEILIRIQGEMNGSVVITNEMMENYGVTEEELFRTAMENASEDPRAEIKTLPDMIFQMGMPEKLISKQEGPPHRMLVVTTAGNYHGAAAVVFPKALQQIRKKIGGDFYLLPSSIHEMIAIPKGELKITPLREMVREINRTVLQKGEFLSDEVYEVEGGELKVA